jgi:predicted phosphodiesterase
VGGGGRLDKPPSTGPAEPPHAPALCLHDAAARGIDRRHLHVPRQRTRILSDIHYGDQSSRVLRLAQMRPLFDGVDRLILNGDTLDTRPGPAPDHTAEIRAHVLEFFPRMVPAMTFLSGNHDADFTSTHYVDLADGAVFVTHGDIFFDNIVPWSADVPLITRLLHEEFAPVPEARRRDLDVRLAVFRRVAARVPQRHQSERNRLKYIASLFIDTVWPPLRIVNIFRSWRAMPQRASETARRYRPQAKFILAGHTHRPGIWPTPGVTVINTGAFCRPFGSFAVDVTEETLTVRTIEFRRDEFRVGTTVAEFPLATQ